MLVHLVGAHLITYSSGDLLVYIHRTVACIHHSGLSTIFYAKKKIFVFNDYVCYIFFSLCIHAMVFLLLS